MPMALYGQESIRIFKNIQKTAKNKECHIRNLLYINLLMWYLGAQTVISKSEIKVLSQHICISDKKLIYCSTSNLNDACALREFYNFRNISES